MAASHVPTQTLTNLTRLELEELRRADGAALGRAVTKGDDGTIIGGVGVGTVLREPFTTGPSVHLDDIYALPPPAAPGGGLGTTTQTSATPSETVQWFGPQYIFDGTGATFGATSLTDTTIVLDFAAASVVAGDFVLIKPSAEVSGIGPNAYAIATVQTTPLAGATTLALNNILTTTGGTTLTAGPKVYSYVIVRKSAVKLFALPGSGTFGAEQAFLFVTPGSTLHTAANPTLAQIEADRVKNIVPPLYNATGNDRADAVFAANPLTLDKLGYRVVFYPDNGAGAPDYSKPILTSTPVINTSLAATEQRMTIDYRAGVVRLSCAPNVGSAIKPTAALSAQGRVNLWAMFWSFDQSITQGSARSLFTQRSDETTAYAPARAYFDLTRKAWVIGASNNTNNFYAKALGSFEDTTLSTEFGTVETTGKGRYFRYQRGSNVWRMRATGDTYDADIFGEVELGGRTAISVGDGSAPRQAPGDVNPTTAFGSSTAVGFRNTTNPIETTLKSTVSNGYSTVHLRKGRYYADRTIHVPPGAIVEGEGPATRIFAKSNAGADLNSIFKVGPNTPWGVYDPTYDGSTVAPTEFDFAAASKIEGFDVVWNPTRRVWGIVQADISTNIIWFNEVKPDGTTVLPGLGIDIKNDSRLLYSSTSPGAAHHTPAHYPRIAYHEGQDEYAVVWVEKDPALNGPQCKLQVVATSTNDPVTFTTRFVTTAQTKMTGSGNFNDHPSVAVDNSNSNVGYAIAVSYWNFGPILTPTEMWTSIYNSSTLADVKVASQSLTIKHVVSSTDVAEDNAGGFLFTWSERNHPIITGTTGDITIGLFTDATFTGATTFPVAGVEAGDRFLHFGNTALAGGFDGIVRAVAAANLTIVQDGDGTPFPDTGGQPLIWAVMPRTSIYSKRYYSGAVSIGARADVIVQDPAGTDYRLEVREPDFVRLSRGGDNWLLVYQAFDSTAFLAQNSVKNFDNGHDTSLIDNAGFTLKDRNPYREHVATCALVLSEAGLPAAPMAGEDVDTLTDEHMRRDLNVSSRSLGGRDPLIVVPNGFGFQHNQKSWNRLISARNFFHKWTATESHSLIPDVTWTGQDWVVVSPSQTEIRSTTGKLTVAAGPTYYLSDATFYFGNDGTIANGKYLRKTITPGTDQIVLESTGQVFNITAIITEHTVQVTPVAGAPGATIDSIEWSLVRPSALGVAAGVKTPGFRVSGDGRLISSTNYVTFADEPDEGSAIPRRTELMLRKNANGVNSPSDLDLGVNDPAFSQSAIWGDVSFRGVAVGAPKGTADNNSFVKESPKCAIAWGENMYGFLDREIRGIAPSLTSRTNFFRQSFGPYRVGFRNFSLVMTNSANSPQQAYLKTLSREHVLTRHGMPATATGGFATDGYRNCFVTPIVTDIKNTYGLTDLRYRQLMQAYYTDANGANVIASYGPEQMEIPEYDVAATYMDDLLSALPNPTGAPSDAVMTNSRPSSPKVIWDGSRFVAAWTEGNYTSLLGAKTLRHGLICLGAFAGGEDQTAQTGELTGDSDFLNKIMEFATVSVGSRNVDHPLRSVFAADLAFSGKTYAVLWTGGQNPSNAPTVGDTNNLGGSAIGVAIFNGAGQESSGNNFVIETSHRRGHFQDGKILWDGRQYVAVWREHDEGAAKGHLHYAVIPENGFGTGSMLLKAASPTTTSGPSASRGIGTVQGGIFPIGDLEGVINISGNPCSVKAGDLVHIDHIEQVGGGIEDSFNGWWVVRDYDPVNHNVYLHYDDLGGTAPWGAGVLPAGANVVIGSIISTSQGDRSTLHNRFDGASKVAQPVTGPYTKGRRLGTVPFGGADLFLDDFDRLEGFVYNEVNDEYAVLLRKSGAMAITTFKRGTLQAAPERSFTVGGGTTCASLAWNGRHYLVAYVDSAIRYKIISPRLSVESEGVIDTDSNLIGNGARQVPGPSYGALRGSSVIQPRMRNIHVKWNPLLNRWIVSASLMWYEERASDATATKILPINFPTTPYTLLGFSNRNINMAGGSPTNATQVGCRMIGVRTGVGSIEGVYTPTVKSIDVGGLTITVDNHFNELSTDVKDNWGDPGGPDPLVVGTLTREDVFCWTLGYTAPAVKLLDADDVWFDAVEFSGGYVDVEERYRNLARPVWQNGGVSFGQPTAASASDSAAKPEHVNHLLMKPTGKTPTVTFSNVRSTTKARHGQR